MKVFMKGICFVNNETFWSHGRTIVAENSLFGKVTRDSGFYEFHSCALCREVSHRELFAKIPSLQFVLSTFSVIPMTIGEDLNKDRYEN